MDSNSVKIYTADAIKQRVTPHLHDEAFAIMALCCGGDYDEVQSLTSPIGDAADMYDRACRNVVLPLHSVWCK
jgi:hypothetical protein